MKKFLKLILGNPKTSIAGLVSALVAILVYKRIITAEESGLYLALIVAIIGFFSRDAAEETQARESEVIGTRPEDRK
jgi:hypothetical protein